MKILAIDTSTESCSVALAIDDQVTTSFELQPRRQTELILPMVNQLLLSAQIQVSDLNVISCTIGPGSFTGLRVGVGVVQGLAYGADLPVIPVSTLAVLAQGAYRLYEEKHVLVALDARRKQVYWGAYELSENKLMILKDRECVVDPDKVEIPDRSLKWMGVGTGFSAYHEKLISALNDVDCEIKEYLYPHAQDIIAFAKDKFFKKEIISSQTLGPVYLRDQI